MPGIAPNGGEGVTQDLTPDQRSACTRALRPHLERVVDRFERRATAEVDLPLTRREREILEWVERGKTNAEIAEILWLSPSPCASTSRTSTASSACARARPPSRACAAISSR